HGKHRETVAEGGQQTTESLDQGALAHARRAADPNAQRPGPDELIPNESIALHVSRQGGTTGGQRGGRGSELAAGGQPPRRRQHPEQSMRLSDMRGMAALDQRDGAAERRSIAGTEGRGQGGGGGEKGGGQRGRG